MGGFELNYWKVKKNNLYLIYKITIELNVNVVTKQTGYECRLIYTQVVCSSLVTAPFYFSFNNCAY